MGGCFGREMPLHSAVKYGNVMPQVPAGDRVGAGSFHRSYDGQLWLFTRAWEPADKSKTWATLMIVHGTVDHAGVYGALGEKLAEQGVAVFASDMRGWGRSDGEPLYFQSMETFTQDVLADYARIHGDESPYSKVKSRFLLGKSLGGLITAWAACRHPEKWTGLIGLSGAYQSDVVPSGLKLLVLNALSTVAPKYPLKQIFDPRLIVSDETELEKWRQDPLVRHGKVSVGYIVEITRGMQELPAQLPNLRTPSLMLWGTGDRVVTEKGHTTMVEASKHEASQLIKYPDGFHNLLAEPAHKAKVIADIEAWMRKLQ